MLFAAAAAAGILIVGCAKSSDESEKAPVAAEQVDESTLGARRENPTPKVEGFLRQWQTKDWDRRERFFSKEIPKQVLEEFFKETDDTSLLKYEILRAKRGVGAHRNIAMVGGAITVRSLNSDGSAGSKELFKTLKKSRNYLLVWEDDDWKIRQFDPKYDRMANQIHFDACMNAALDLGLGEQVFKKRAGEYTANLKSLTGRYPVDTGGCRENLRIELDEPTQSFRVVARSRTLPECDIVAASNVGGISAPTVKPDNLDMCLSQGRD